MTPAGLAMLGVAQCVNWGVLYYAFAVVLLPVETELGVARWMITAAFSLALLVSALLAPTIGGWADRGHGPFVMQAGGYCAAALLAIWSAFPSLPMLYFVWTGLGASMAATLYEPVFIIVGRAIGTPQDRLRALAAVTVFGGLASTVFLPLTAWLVRDLGWRPAVSTLAILVATVTLLTRLLVFRHLAAPHAIGSPTTRIERGEATAVPALPFALLVTMFGLATLASAAFTSNIVPALGELSVSPTTAALLGAILGVMQVPGRALLMRGHVEQSPQRLVIVSLVCQGLGLAALSVIHGVGLIGIAIAVFAIGSGLTTLARPYVVHSAFRIEHAGAINGRLARAQQLARAAGPTLATWSAASIGYATTFLALAALFGGLALISSRVLGQLHQLRIPQEEMP